MTLFSIIMEKSENANDNFAIEPEESSLNYEDSKNFNFTDDSRKEE